ncbi:thyroid receptor-interacting protein 11-like [Bolinopsis microptera]|uniref:thyroid receptor-interacting protein 11-like n=1 Tax=Bolinopsis microptera TaxID=2820187 RepID=UPI00307A3957
MANNNNSGHYSGWLGGYAKSVAGTVSAFTQDILEETRADTQDVNSLLKVSNERVVESEGKIQSLESEISKLKRDLAEVNEDREVTELQLQEVGDRWRSILNEKEEEFKALKDRFSELENEKSVKKATRLRNVSGDIDFSDPFMCEMEIGRLIDENQMLVAQAEKLSSKSNSQTSRTEENGENESKIMELQAQLRSVYMEHQNELALKDQETERAIHNLREEFQRSNDVDPYSRRSSHSESETDAELHRKYSELQFQFKREQGYFKQLEQEKLELETKLQEFKDSFSKLKSENSVLNDRVTELDECKKHVVSLEEKIVCLEQDAAKKNESHAGITQYEAVIDNLNSQMGEKTVELTSIRSKLSQTESLLSNRDKEIHQLRMALNTVQSEDFQELRGLVDSLKMQVDGYKETLKETGHKLLHSNQKVETLSTQEVELKATVSCLQTETLRQSETIRDLQLQVRTKDDFISELQESSSSLRRSGSDTTEKLEALQSEHQTVVRLCNQLKAEKLELVVDSKKVREGSTKLQKEMKRISAEQARIQQNGLSFILEAQLTESQMVEIKEIVSGEKPTDSESCNSSEMRELKRKLADKSEQLRMLQGKISKLKSDQEEMISPSEHDTALSDLKLAHNVMVASLNEQIDNAGRECEDLNLQIVILGEENSKLTVENIELKNEMAEKSENEKSVAEISTISADKEFEFEKTMIEYTEKAQKEKTRLLMEIERLMDETSVVEEEYTTVVSDKERLEGQVEDLKGAVTTVQSEKENTENKLAKVSENLKKALARLEVKDAKIEELSDQVTGVEKKLVESNELVAFFRSNQTDEYKAARLGLSEVSTPSSTVETANYVTGNDVTPYVSSNVTSLTQQIEELTQKVRDAEARCGKLAEIVRDKDLKLDLIEAEMLSAGDASLSEAETNKLIDQNMRLQKVCTNTDKELESMKQQNLEIIHQRDFYQDQAKKLHESMEALRAEANKLISDVNDREQKTATELERLQEHLVKAEETHTEDYLLATRSEQDLRAEVAGLREQILTANQSLHSVRAESSHKISELTSQVHVLTKQRDTALQQVSSAGDSAASCQSSLSNLQIVLEQFQQDREGYASEIQHQYKRDLDVMTGKLDVANTTISKLEARVSEIRIIEEDFKASREDSKSKDDRIKSLQHEVSKLDVALKVAQEGLQKVRTTAEDKVERSLIKAFFTQYITAPDNRKPEVLKLMTSILNYSEEELEVLQRSKDKKWLSSLLAPASLGGAGDKDALPGQSFSELFVSFLETEANRGAIMSSRGGSVTTPTPQRSTSALSHHRSPSSSSTTPFHHQRSPSSASNTSAQSAPVTTSKDSSGTVVDTTTAATSLLAGALPVGNTTPLVVPASLADLLGNKPR